MVIFQIEPSLSLCLALKPTWQHLLGHLWTGNRERNSYALAACVCVFIARSLAEIKINSLAFSLHSLRRAKVRRHCRRKQLVPCETAARLESQAGAGANHKPARMSTAKPADAADHSSVCMSGCQVCWLPVDWRLPAALEPVRVCERA